MFPPSTPPMIITMCSSSILNEMRRLRDNVTFTPEELDTLIVWKEGATPQPNPNPARPPPPPASSVLAEGQPLPFVPSSSEDIAASGEATATGEEGEEKWPEGMPKVRECGSVCGGALDRNCFLWQEFSVCQLFETKSSRHVWGFTRA